MNRILFKTKRVSNSVKGGVKDLKLIIFAFNKFSRCLMNTIQLFSFNKIKWLIHNERKQCDFRINLRVLVAKFQMKLTRF